ncbi:hypothetical protein PMIN02_005909 [Paraphaeosphaeria minitans]
MPIIPRMPPTSPFMSTIWAYHHPMSLRELASHPPPTLQLMAAEIEACLQQDYTGRNSPRAMRATLNKVRRLLRGGRPDSDSDFDSDGGYGGSGGVGYGVVGGMGYGGNGGMGYGGSRGMGYGVVYGGSSGLRSAGRRGRISRPASDSSDDRDSLTGHAGSVSSDGSWD